MSKLAFSATHADTRVVYCLSHVTPYKHAFFLVQQKIMQCKACTPSLPKILDVLGCWLDFAKTDIQSRPLCAWTAMPLALARPFGSWLWRCLTLTCHCPLALTLACHWPSRRCLWQSVPLACKKPLARSHAEKPQAKKSHCQGLKNAGKKEPLPRLEPGSQHSNFCTMTS